MRLKTFTIIDDQFINAGISIPGATEHLLVEGELLAPGLPVFIERAYWEESGQGAHDFAAAHETEIASLLAMAVSEALEDM